MKAKISIAILVVLILSLVLSAVSVFAAGPTTFTLNAYHNVKGNDVRDANGDKIHLAKDAPVAVAVVKDGKTIANLNMKYHDRVQANLPGGTYKFIFNDAKTGDTLFTCGPYKIKNGDTARLQAHEQGPGRMADCYVNIKK